MQPPTTLPPRTIQLEHSNSLAETLSILAGLLIPMLLPGALRAGLHLRGSGWDFLASAALGWPVIGLALFGLLWVKIIRPRRRRTLSIEGSSLALLHHGQVDQSIDLSRPHKLFLLARDQRDYEMSQIRHWVDVFISQDGQVLAFRLFLRSGPLSYDKDPRALPARRSELPALLLVSSLGLSSRFQASLLTINGIHASASTIPESVLRDLCAVSHNNALADEIGAVRTGQLSLASLARRLRTPL